MSKRWKPTKMRDALRVWTVTWIMLRKSYMWFKLARTHDLGQPVAAQTRLPRNERV